VFVPAFVPVYVSISGCACVFMCLCALVYVCDCACVRGVRVCVRGGRQRIMICCISLYVRWVSPSQTLTHVHMHTSTYSHFNTHTHKHTSMIYVYVYPCIYVSFKYVNI